MARSTAQLRQFGLGDTEEAYNHANRRVGFTRGGQAIAQYDYNPLGQRIVKRLGGTVVERYTYGPSGQLLQVRNGANQPLREYLYLNGKLVGMINAAESATALYYVHHDHLGTPQKLTNQDQQVVWSADYTPFGEATVTGEQEVYSRFPGQYYDEESGLYYNYFRDYDPSLGRYIQSDPIGLGDGPNTYGYVYQNPLRYTDPFGLDGGIGQGAYGGLGKNLSSPKQCDCSTYNRTIGPLTRAQADELNIARGDVGNVLAAAAGATSGFMVTRFFGAKAGAAVVVPVDLAYGGSYARRSPNLHPGDIIKVKVTVCPSNTSDSGIEVEVEEVVIPAN